ncbi:prickle-like protein 1 [Centruroides sculpturatus]|uniref:prickle-like protein 1 n=1 Tax=Centruroides sculpturatus TaxID=218467 RepID=UPI000C6D5C3C|nr:prickle-like protein 1 [Centruroides sculpturatus]
MGLKDQLEQNGVEDKRTAVEEGYSWVPPDLAPDKIQSYFARIPSGKVPKSGTPGGKTREKQLIIKLPDKHFSMKICKFLKKVYQQLCIDFINEHDKTAMDIAYVKSAMERTVLYFCKDANKCNDDVYKLTLTYTFFTREINKQFIRKRKSKDYLKIKMKFGIGIVRKSHGFDYFCQL